MPSLHVHPNDEHCKQRTSCSQHCRFEVLFIVVLVLRPSYSADCVMYGTDGGFQPPIALPFDNSLLGQMFQFYLENILMPFRLVFPLLPWDSGCMSCS